MSPGISSPEATAEGAVGQEVMLENDASGPALDRVIASGKGSLETKAATATVWTIFSYGASQVLRMGNNVVLTRLLVPASFGLMALLTTFVIGMTLLSDVGLQPSVISSHRGDEPDFLNTAWTIQIVRGLALWLIACMLAWPLSRLYHEPRIASILPVLAFTLVIGGFGSSNLLSAARHIGVKRLVSMELSTQLLGIIVMLAWAWYRPTVWALVGGTLASALAKTVLSHIPFVLPGRRNTLHWDKSCVQELIHFGKWIMVGTACYFFATQADRLMLGRLVTFTVLGVYGIAYTVSDIPRQVILQFSSRVGYPFVSKLNGLPREEFAKRVRHYRFYVLCAGAVILSAVVNGGGFVVTKLYDARYHAAVWIVPILGLGLWHTLLYNTTSPVLFSLGKPKYNAIGTACFFVTIFVSLPIAFHFWGLAGAVVSVAAADLPFYVVLNVGASRERVSLWRQDAMATCVFLLVLGLGFLIHRALA